MNGMFTVLHACWSNMQIGASDMVINMALPLLENWEVRKAYKRDILLALAMAYCSKARDLLTNEQVRTGSGVRHSGRACAWHATACFS